MFNKCSLIRWSHSVSCFWSNSTPRLNPWWSISSGDQKNSLKNKIKRVRYCLIGWDRLMGELCIWSREMMSADSHSKKMIWISLMLSSSMSKKINRLSQWLVVRTELVWATKRRNFCKAIPKTSQSAPSWTVSLTHHNVWQAWSLPKPSIGLTWRLLTSSIVRTNWKYPTSLCRWEPNRAMLKNVPPAPLATQPASSE